MLNFPHPCPSLSDSLLAQMVKNLPVKASVTGANEVAKVPRANHLGPWRQSEVILQCHKVSLCGKESACNAGNPGYWVRKIHWRRKWQPTSLFLPGESHGQRSLALCQGCPQLPIVRVQLQCWASRKFRGLPS